MPIDLSKLQTGRLNDVFKNSLNFDGPNNPTIFVIGHATAATIRPTLDARWGHGLNAQNLRCTQYGTSTFKGLLFGLVEHPDLHRRDIVNFKILDAAGYS